MPAKRGRGSFRPRRFGQRPTGQESRAGGIELQRRAVPQPPSPTTLRAAVADGDGVERWELICRDGWDWQPAPAVAGAPAGAPLVWVRAADLNPDQAAVIGHWIERIRDPAAWWEVSRALQTPESAPVVAQALEANPWLRGVLPVVLEASTDGAPPPPPVPRD